MSTGRIIAFLGVLLGVQLLLAVALHLGERGLAPAATASAPLAAFDPAAVTRVRIEAPAGEPVVLEQAGGEWRLPALGGFPADGGKIERLLERLAAIERGQPIATSKQALQRFELTADNFQRRLLLEGEDGTLAELLLGTSPGMGRVHARTPADEAVYSIELELFRVPGDRDDWVDKTLLALPAADIEAIEVAGLRLERAEPAAAGDARQQTEDAAEGEPATPPWRATAGLGAGESLADGAAEALVEALGSLRFDAVLGEQAQADWGLENPALTLSVVRADAGRREYRLGEIAGEDAYALALSDHGQHFRLAAYQASRLLGSASREALVSGPEQAGGQTGEQAGEMDAAGAPPPPQAAAPGGQE